MTSYLEIICIGNLNVSRATLIFGRQSFSNIDNIQGVFESEQSKQGVNLHEKISQIRRITFFYATKLPSSITTRRARNIPLLDVNGLRYS